MLRREGYHGDLTLLSADDSVPYDRPTLSKDFLNGSASQKMIPLRSKDFYKKHEIELLLKTRVGGDRSAEQGCPTRRWQAAQI